MIKIKCDSHFSAGLELSRTYFEIGKRLGASGKVEARGKGKIVEGTSRPVPYTPCLFPWDLEQMEKVRQNIH